MAPAYWAARVIAPALPVIAAVGKKVAAVALEGPEAQELAETAAKGEGGGVAFAEDALAIGRNKAAQSALQLGAKGAGKAAAKGATRTRRVMTAAKNRAARGNKGALKGQRNARAVHKCKSAGKASEKAKAAAKSKANYERMIQEKIEQIKKLKGKENLHARQQLWQIQRAAHRQGFIKGDPGQMPTS